MLRIPLRGVDARRARARARLDRAGAQAARRRRALRASLRARARLAAGQCDVVLREPQRGGRDRVHGGRTAARRRALSEAAHARSCSCTCPALAVLALYPLAPPHWVAGMPFADGPPLHPSALRNETAAAVSLHFGGPVFIAAGALWLRPRAPLAWLTLLYPLLVFVVILGTGNHYVLDTLVGSSLRRRGLRRRSADPRPAPARVARAPAGHASRLREQASDCSRSSSMEASSESWYERPQRPFAHHDIRTSQALDRANATSRRRTSGCASSRSCSQGCSSTSESVPRRATTPARPRRTRARSSISSTRSGSRARAICRV